MLYDPAAGRLTGVIDFGDLALGDPARDFIYLYEDFGADLLAAVLRHYPRYAGEPAAALLPRVRAWYLLETVAWTLDRHAHARPADVAHGLAEVARELDAPLAPAGRAH